MTPNLTLYNLLGLTEIFHLPVIKEFVFTIKDLQSNMTTHKVDELNDTFIKFTFLIKCLCLCTSSLQICYSGTSF